MILTFTITTEHVPSYHVVFPKKIWKESSGRKLGSRTAFVMRRLHARSEKSHPRLFKMYNESRASSEAFADIYLGWAAPPFPAYLQGIASSMGACQFRANGLASLNRQLEARLRVEASINSSTLEMQEELSVALVLLPFDADFAQFPTQLASAAVRLETSD